MPWIVAGSTVNEQGLPDVLRGRKATIYFASSQNRAELKPERIFVDEIEAEDFSDPLPVDSLSRIEKNWFDCIRSGATPLANIDLAIRIQTVLSLAEMSERMSLTLLFDEKTRTIKTGSGKVVPPISFDSVVPMST